MVPIFKNFLLADNDIAIYKRMIIAAKYEAFFYFHQQSMLNWVDTKQPHKHKEEIHNYTQLIPTIIMKTKEPNRFPALQLHCRKCLNQF